jgi:DNA repair protein RadC
VRISDIQKENRPRERFLKLGPQSLSDAELLAIILRTGTRGKKGQLGENVIDMSNRLISQFGLDKLFNCSLKELQEINGIGPSKAMQLLSIAELNKRISLIKNNIINISCAKDVFLLLRDKLKDEKQENFIVILLNNKNKIIKEEYISKGVLDAAIIDPREIFKPAIRNSASRLIIVHNHPSGDPSPSEEDEEITKAVVEAGELLQIQVLDHVIIGKESYWSWKESC